MTCPFCKEEVQDGAIKCKHCRSMLTNFGNKAFQGHQSQMVAATYAPQHLSLTHLFFSHQGRTNRAKYWLGSLLLMVMYGVPYAFFESINPGLGPLAAFITIYPSIMLNIQRAHDLDRSGHFCWLLVIPLVNIVPGLMLGFCRGTTGPNRFGPDPLAPSPVFSPEALSSQTV
jgi:uncharacterized membrane protein YhaH (DUF805 family)